MPNLILIIMSFLFLQCKGQDNSVQESNEAKRTRQDLLIEKYVKNCAQKYNYRFQMQE